MNLKKHSVDEQKIQSAQGAKKKEIYVMKSYMKGKKKQIAHTMSNIMNKAKVIRRHSFSHNLSDEEENPSQKSSSHQRTTRSTSSAVHSKRSCSDTETDVSSMFSDGEENELYDADNQAEALSLFATMGESLVKPSDTGDSDKNSDRPVSDSSTSSRKQTKESQPEVSEPNSFNLNFSSTSMEFAVSRKIGIFRKKSSVTDDAPQTLPATSGTSPTATSTFVVEKFEFETIDEPDLPAIEPIAPPQSQNKKTQPVHLLMKTHSIFVDSIDDENGLKTNSNGNGNGNDQPYQSRPPVPSPRFEHSRSNSMKGNSLDVPGYREDEDNKSQHSFRTISSSRRQSTEDSIDTDDEYFYYEMRNLEELERNSHMESILQDDKNELINNIIQLDASLGKCEHEPDEEVKKQMGYVLHELKSKVKLREAQDDKRQDVMNNNRTKNIYDKFSLATNIQDMPWNRDSDDDYDADDHMDQLNMIEKEMRDTSYGKVKKKRKKGKAQKYSESSSSSADEDKSIPSGSPPHDEFHLNVDKFDRHSQSSGVTSGPDSPIQSDDEHVEADKCTEDYDQFKQRQKNERLLDSAQQPPHGDDDRGANVNMVQSEESAATETELNSNEHKHPLRKIMQMSSTISTDSTNQDSGISDTSGGPNNMSSSKWKLLKTLKERKEMNNQVKIKEEEEGGNEKKVSFVHKEWKTRLCAASFKIHFCKKKFSRTKIYEFSVKSSPSNRCVWIYLWFFFCVTHFFVLSKFINFFVFQSTFLI